MQPDLQVTLQDLTPQNWHQCLELKLPADQQDFVAPNVYSIAQARFLPDAYPLAIFQGEQMVGFVMYTLDPDDGQYWIYRLMIDEKHQRKGLGTLALQQVVDRIFTRHHVDRILLGVMEGNPGARALYEKAGFKPNGQVFGREVVLQLERA